MEFVVNVEKKMKKKLKQKYKNEFSINYKEIMRKYIDNNETLEGEDLNYLPFINIIYIDYVDYKNKNELNRLKRQGGLYNWHSKRWYILKGIHKKKYFREWF